MVIIDYPKSVSLWSRNDATPAFSPGINNPIKQTISCKVIFERLEVPDVVFLSFSPLGTVIDTDIVSPNDFDFYLNSHAAIQGTSRPMTSSNWREFPRSSPRVSTASLHRYYLRHTDVRCTKAVSVPAPVHYATLCVSRGLSLDYEGQRADGHPDQTPTLVNGHIRLSWPYAVVLYRIPSLSITIVLLRVGHGEIRSSTDTRKWLFIIIVDDRPTIPWASIVYDPRQYNTKIVNDCIPSYTKRWNTIVILSHVIRHSTAGYVPLIEHVQSYTVVYGFRNRRPGWGRIDWPCNEVLHFLKLTGFQQGLLISSMCVRRLASLYFNHSFWFLDALALPNAVVNKQWLKNESKIYRQL